MGHSENQGCRGEVRILSARRGAGTKSQMLVAKIRNKWSRSKESVLVGGHSSGSGGKEAWSQSKEGGVRESRRNGGDEGHRWTDEQTYI